MAERIKPCGFTLIELMLALAILALLLLLGLPSFTAFLRNSEIRSTAESMINGLRTASAEAANRNTNVTFELAGDGGADWKFWYRDDDDKEVVVQSYSKKEAGPNTKITVFPIGQTRVAFNGLGRVANQGMANDHLQQVDIDSLVSGEARPLRIIVDDPDADPAKRRGLRMCDPDPALAALVPPDPRAC